MRSVPHKALAVVVGVVVLLVVALATGNWLRTDDSQAPPETTSVSAQSQPVASPDPETDGADALPADPQPEDTESTDTMGPDPLLELRYLHEQLVQGRGGLVSGSLNSGELVEGSFALDAPGVLWSASGSGVESLIRGNQLVAQIPKDTDLGFLGEQRGAASTVAAVTGGGQLLAVGMVDSAGSFLPIHIPPMLSMGLTLGGEELFRFQYSPPPTDPCTSQEPPEYESPLHAIVTYLGRLGDQTELAMERVRQETDQQVQDIYASAPSLTDPVTGLAVQVSVTDIENQLGRVDGEEVEVRPAIPVEIRLLSEEAAKERASEVMVFIDQTSGEFLGAFSVVTQTTGPATSRVFGTAILEIAPPEEGGNVAVVVREEAGRETFCGDIADGENVITIPYDDIAGKTRASISIADNTYTKVTEFELSN